MDIYYDKDADLSLIRDCSVAILGFGAQGRAHALNLRDSGVEVVVGLRPDSGSRATCERLELPNASIADAVRSADLVMMLVPDEIQPSVYGDFVGTNLRAGGAIGFAHGFNLQYRRIQPREDMDVIMIAPLGIGDQVRKTYVDGGGVPGLIGIHQNVSGTARELALAYASALGHGRAGIMETTIADETETDLFAEQAVLCGGVTHLVIAAFETLVEAGYPEELAYFCCLHELKLMTDLVHTRGIAGMRESVSSTAEYGDYTRGPRVINAQSRRAMREMLAEIRSGRFAQELQKEMESGQQVIHDGRGEARRHPIENVGRRLRGMMPWLRDEK